MIIFSIRPLNDEEKQAAAKRKPTTYKTVETFIMMFIGILFVLLVPLLVVDKFYPISSNAQGIYCIVIIIISFATVTYINNKFRGGLINKKKGAITDEVEAIHVKTARAIKRKDFEDFGIAFYVDVMHNGVQKTLFLWGQYLDELEYDNLFPNTEFEFIRQKNSDEFIGFKILGQYFKEEKTLPAFDKEIWKTGVYPINGQLLDMSIDEIV